MAEGSVFPAFLKLEYQPSGSAKSSFLAEMASISTDAKRQFENAFGDISQTISKSLSGFKSGAFKFDIDVSGLRQAASDADFTAQRLTALRDAAISLAASSGDTSQATQNYVKALRAQVIEANLARDAANSQVNVYSRLQAEIDKTASSNTRLADSYRATFAEQAKAANYAAAFQKAINQRAGTNLNDFGPTKSARDSASVFESQSYAPKADVRSGLDRLMAGQASIDKAALSGATLEQVLGRVANQGREVSAALQDAERAAAGLAATRLAENEAALAKAAAEAKSYAAAANVLRAQLDPALAIQQKFDAELTNAERLLAANAINQKEYAQAVALAQNNLRDSWASLTGSQEENIRVTKRGTSETGNVINGIRAQRVAFTQLGQQMQDVVVQTQMGTNATTIFVQQVPQMAFALSGLAESTNKTYSRIGQFASFLAGPWGAAVFAATAILGPLIASQISFGNALDDAVAKLKKDAEETETTRKAKEIFAKTEQGVTLAINEQKLALDKQADSLRKEAERARDAAKQNLDYEIATRKTTQALLEQVQARAEAAKFAAQSALDPNDLAGAQQVQSIYEQKANSLEERLRKNAEAIAKAQTNLANAQSFVDTKAGKDAADPIKAIEKQYDTLIEQARRRAVAEGNVGAALTAQVTALEKQRKAAVDAQRASQRTGGSGSGLYGREINSDQAQAIARGAGFRVTDADRTIAEQRYLYEHKRTKQNPVAYPDANAPHVRGNALDIAFADGVTPASIRKAYADEGVRLTKILKETGHFHIEWSTSGSDKAIRDAERIRKQADAAAKALAEFGSRSAESIQRINERFNEQPRLIDAAAAATRDLDKTIADLSERKPAGFEQMIADAQAAKGVIEEALVRPFEKLREETERRAQIQDLLSSGKEAEAAAVQQIWQLEQQLGPLTAERKAEVMGIAAAEQKHIEALQRVQQIQSAYLDATRSVRSEVEAILGGYGKISNLKGIFQQLQGKILTEQIFGDVFRDMDKWIKEKTGIGSSVDMMAKEVDRAGTAAQNFADQLVAATNTMAGAAGGSALGSAGAGIGSSWARGNLTAPSLLAAPSNDNGIVVVASKPGKATVNDLSPQQYFEQMSAKLTKPLIDSLGSILGPSLANSLGKPLTGALEGYLTTGTGFGAVLGGLKDIKGLPESLSKGLGDAFKGAQTGTTVAGIGNALGLGLSNTGSQIGGALGSLTGVPGLDIAGSIVGGLIGKLFGKRPRGSGSVTQDSVSASANDNGIQDALGSFGTDLQGAIGKIASALGAQVGSYNVGIGRYKDYYQVSGVGNDGRLGNSYFGRDSSNALYDGKDPAAAMQAALLNALQDGAIKGIRQGAIRLLQSGKDLDAQIQKAVDFQNVFKELKQFKDPVGAAIDGINEEFTKLKATFSEAGASAAELADLEELYGIKRAAAIKAANDQVLGSMKDLIKSLTVDNANRSLKDREAAALKAFDPLKARVLAGDSTAFNDFTQAAQDLLSIQRDLYGSQAKYFASEDAIKSITQAAIDKAQQVSDAAANRDSPFKSSGSTAANDNASVTAAIDRQTQEQRDIFKAVNDNLGSLVRQNRDLALALQKAMAGGAYNYGRGNF